MRAPLIAIAPMSRDLRWLEPPYINEQFPLSAGLVRLLLIDDRLELGSVVSDAVGFGVPNLAPAEQESHNGLFD
jgi:hypothetical protein